MKNKILVIEDDADINTLLKKILERAGYEAETAFSGTEGRLLLKLNSYDLVLLDLMLPGLSGEELLTEIRKTLRMPVIALTAKEMCIRDRSNAFHRSGIACRIINGLLGLDHTPGISLTEENTASRPEAIKAWKEIGEWVKAAAVKRELSGCRFGFLGNTYNGMLDMYSDFTMIQAQTGAHIEILEMCDLNRELSQVTEEEVLAKKQEILEFFLISEEKAADPLAQKPTDEQLDWSARVAAAQERLVRDYGLDALTYYYHGSPGGEYEKLQSGFIVGHSLLTARGIPCAGEGDLKTCLAMKICDILGTGGSFCEIVTVDYEDGTILLGHDGPFHLAIAKGKPILRGMGLYHGKQGTGVSVEAKVRTGPITNLACTQTIDGRLKFIITEALSTDGPIMTIGLSLIHILQNCESRCQYRHGRE